MRVPKSVVAAFIIVNLLLIAVCVFAAQQNAKLRKEAAFDQALLLPPTGAAMPPLIGENWTGSQQAITYGGDRRPTLVYTFSKGCPYCKQSWRTMRSFQTLAPDKLRIVYIDTSRDLFAPQYLDATGIGKSTLLIQLSLSSAYAYDARAVPQVLLLDRGGHVQWSHIGELAPRDLSRPLSLIGHN